MPFAPSTHQALNHRTWRLQFGATATGMQVTPEGLHLRLCVPLLEGDPYDVGPWSKAHSAHDADAGWTLSVWCAAAGEPIETATTQIYNQLLSARDRQPVCRLWNFVPAINDEPLGLENYRRFCRARSLAYERAGGLQAASALPAASAVGTDGAELVVIALRGPTAAQPFENPLQTPAWRYPEAYGPRPPTFARACKVEDRGIERYFISGTASIRASETLHPGELIPQLAITLENLDVLGRELGLGPLLDRAAQRPRWFQVYLRRVEDLAQTQAFLETSLLHAHDQVRYVRADICRADLEVEIEAILTTTP